MPLVFSENEDTESGIRYADQTGISYQYPKMYRRLIQPGERFVYYRGRKKMGGGRQPQVYFGSGIVGKIELDTADSSRMRCSVSDYRPFAESVSFKRPDGTYLENGGSRRGYFQRGVRSISEEEYERIVNGVGNSLPTAMVASASVILGGRNYASPETIVAVEKYAVNEALAELRAKFPSAKIVPQSRNNPGFDVLVIHDGEPLYVEVKGTRRPTPQFILTQGEMEFSLRNHGNYLLIVVYGIDLDGKKHRLHWHRGAITTETFGIKPLQLICEVLP